MGGAVKRLRDGQSKHQTCALTEYVPNDRSAASVTWGKNWQSSRLMFGPWQTVAVVQ